MALLINQQTIGVCGNGKQQERNKKNIKFESAPSGNYSK